eukprot:358534-Chlamydomonas_euryale.AAC.6
MHARHCNALEPNSRTPRISTAPHHSHTTVAPRSRSRRSTGRIWRRAPPVLSTAQSRRSSCCWRTTTRPQSRASASTSRTWRAPSASRRSRRRRCGVGVWGVGELQGGRCPCVARGAAAQWALDATTLGLELRLRLSLDYGCPILSPSNRLTAQLLNHVTAKPPDPSIHPFIQFHTSCLMTLHIIVHITNEECTQGVSKPNTKDKANPWIALQSGGQLYF